MGHMDSALLEFNPELDKLPKGKELRDGLSVVVQVGDTLWIANDETISLERLSRQQGSANGDCRYGEHEQFALNHYLRLPAPPPSDPKDIEEADVEGLDYKDGYLWLVGSHSLKRGKPDQDDSVGKNFKRLAKVSSDGNRDLCVHGSDLLILAGPTMDLDGPVTIFRWERGAQPNGESLWFAATRWRESWMCPMARV